MYCWKYHLIATETSICIITTKVVTHIFAAEIVTCIPYVLQKLLTALQPKHSITSQLLLLNSNSIKIHQCTSCKNYHVKTYINATDVVTCLTSRKCQLHSSNRNFHLQKWCQPEANSFSNKKEDKQMSKD